MTSLHANDYRWDLFISYAHEDKLSCAQPLAEKLMAFGLRVWFDVWCLKIGHSLRRRINDGLKQSKYAVVILSEHFFSKDWPQMELRPSSPNIG